MPSQVSAEALKHWPFDYSAATSINSAMKCRMQLKSGAAEFLKILKIARAKKTLNKFQSFKTLNKFQSFK